MRKNKNKEKTWFFGERFFSFVVGGEAYYRQKEGMKEAKKEKTEVDVEREQADDIWDKFMEGKLDVSDDLQDILEAAWHESEEGDPGAKKIADKFNEVVKSFKEGDLKYISSEKRGEMLISLVSGLALEVKKIDRTKDSYLFGHRNSEISSLLDFNAYSYKRLAYFDKTVESFYSLDSGMSLDIILNVEDLSDDFLASTESRNAHMWDNDPSESMPVFQETLRELKNSPPLVHEFMKKDPNAQELYKEMFEASCKGDQEGALKKKLEMDSYVEVFRQLLIAKNDMMVNEEDMEKADTLTKIAYALQGMKISNEEVLDLWLEANSKTDPLALQPVEHLDHLRIYFEATVINTESALDYLGEKTRVQNKFLSKRQSLISDTDAIQERLMKYNERLQKAKKEAWEHAEKNNYDKNDPARFSTAKIAKWERSIEMSILRYAKNGNAMLLNQLQYNTAVRFMGNEVPSKDFDKTKNAKVVDDIFRVRGSKGLKRVSAENELAVSPHIAHLESLEFGLREKKIDSNFADLLANGGELMGYQVDKDLLRRDYQRFHLGKEDFSKAVIDRMQDEIKNLHGIRNDVMDRVLEEEAFFVSLLDSGKNILDFEEKDQAYIQARLIGFKALLGRFQKVNIRLASTFTYFENLSEEQRNQYAYLNLDTMQTKFDGTGEEPDGNYLGYDEYAEDLMMDNEDMKKIGDGIDLFIDKNKNIDLIELENFKVELKKIEEEERQLAAKLDTAETEFEEAENKEDARNEYALFLSTYIGANTKILDRLKYSAYVVSKSGEHLDLDEKIKEVEANIERAYEKGKALGASGVDIVEKEEEIYASAYQQRMIERELNFRGTTDKLKDSKFNGFSDRFVKLGDWAKKLTSHFEMRKEDERGITTAMFLGGIPEDFYREGVQNYADIISFVDDSRGSLESEKDRLIALKDKLPADSELYEKYPELKKVREHILDKKIDEINVLLTSPDSPFSEDMKKRLMKEKRLLKEKSDEYDLETLKQIASNAVILAVAVGVTMATSGLASMAVGAVGLSGSTAGMVVMTGVSAFGSTVGGIGGMYASDAIGLSEFGEQGAIDKAWGDFGKTFAQNLAFQWISIGVVGGLKHAATAKYLTKSKYATLNTVGRGVKNIGKGGLRALNAMKPYAAPGSSWKFLAKHADKMGIETGRSIAINGFKGTAGDFVKSMMARYVTELGEEVLEELSGKTTTALAKKLGASDKTAEFLGTVAELTLATVNSADGVNVQLTSMGINADRAGISVTPDGDFNYDGTPQAFMKKLESEFEMDIASDYQMTIDPDTGTIALDLIAPGLGGAGHIIISPRGTKVSTNKAEVDLSDEDIVELKAETDMAVIDLKAQKEMQAIDKKSAKAELKGKEVDRVKVVKEKAKVLSRSENRKKKIERKIEKEKKQIQRKEEKKQREFANAKKVIDSQIKELDDRLKSEISVLKIMLKGEIELVDKKLSDAKEAGLDAEAMLKVVQEVEQEKSEIQQKYLGLISSANFRVAQERHEMNRDLEISRDNILGKEEEEGAYVSERNFLKAISSEGQVNYADVLQAMASKAKNKQDARIEEAKEKGVSEEELEALESQVEAIKIKIDENLRTKLDEIGMEPRQRDDALELLYDSLKYSPRFRAFDKRAEMAKVFDKFMNTSDTELFEVGDFSKLSGLEKAELADLVTQELCEDAELTASSEKDKRPHQRELVKTKVKAYMDQVAMAHTMRNGEMDPQEYAEQILNFYKRKNDKQNFAHELFADDVEVETGLGGRESHIVLNLSDADFHTLYSAITNKPTELTLDESGKAAGFNLDYGAGNVTVVRRSWAEEMESTEKGKTELEKFYKHEGDHAMTKFLQMREQFGVNVNDAARKAEKEGKHGLAMSLDFSVQYNLMQDEMLAHLAEGENLPEIRKILLEHYQSKLVEVKTRAEAVGLDEEFKDLASEYARDFDAAFKQAEFILSQPNGKAMLMITPIHEWGSLSNYMALRHGGDFAALADAFRDFSLDLPDPSASEFDIEQLAYSPTMQIKSGLKVSGEKVVDKKSGESVAVELAPVQSGEWSDGEIVAKDGSQESGESVVKIEGMRQVVPGGFESKNLSSFKNNEGKSFIDLIPVSLDGGKYSEKIENSMNDSELIKAEDLVDLLMFLDYVQQLEAKIDEMRLSSENARKQLQEAVNRLGGSWMMKLSEGESDVLMKALANENIDGDLESLSRVVGGVLEFDNMNDLELALSKFTDGKYSDLIEKVEVVTTSGNLSVKKLKMKMKSGHVVELDLKLSEMFKDSNQEFVFDKKQVFAWGLTMEDRVLAQTEYGLAETAFAFDENGAVTIKGTDIEEMLMNMPFNPKKGSAEYSLRRKAEAIMQDIYNGAWVSTKGEKKDTSPTVIVDDTLKPLAGEAELKDAAVDKVKGSGEVILDTEFAEEVEKSGMIDLNAGVKPVGSGIKAVEVSDGIFVSEDLFSTEDLKSMMNFTETKADVENAEAEIIQAKNDVAKIDEKTEGKNGLVAKIATVEKGLVAMKVKVSIRARVLKTLSEFLKSGVKWFNENGFLNYLKKTFKSVLPRSNKEIVRLVVVNYFKNLADVSVNAAVEKFASGKDKVSDHSRAFVEDVVSSLNEVNYEGSFAEKYNAELRSGRSHGEIVDDLFFVYRSLLKFTPKKAPLFLRALNRTDAYLFSSFTRKMDDVPTEMLAAEKLGKTDAEKLQKKLAAKEEGPELKDSNEKVALSAAEAVAFLDISGVSNSLRHELFNMSPNYGLLEKFEDFALLAEGGINTPLTNSLLIVLANMDVEFYEQLRDLIVEDFLSGRNKDDIRAELLNLGQYLKGVDEAGYKRLMKVFKMLATQENILAGRIVANRAEGVEGSFVIEDGKVENKDGEDVLVEHITFVSNMSSMMKYVDQMSAPALRDSSLNEGLIALFESNGTDAEIRDLLITEIVSGRDVDEISLDIMSLAKALKKVDVANYNKLLNVMTSLKNFQSDFVRKISVKGSEKVESPPVALSQVADESNVVVEDDLFNTLPVVEPLDAEESVVPPPAPKEAPAPVVVPPPAPVEAPAPVVEAAEEVVARDGVEKTERAKAIEDESSKIEMAQEAQELPRDLEVLEKNNLNVIKIEEGEEFAFSILDEIGAPVYLLSRKEGKLIVVNEETGKSVSVLNEGGFYKIGLGVHIQHPSEGFVNIAYDDSFGVESVKVASSVARIKEGRENQKASSSVEDDLFNTLPVVEPSDAEMASSGETTIGPEVPTPSSFESVPEIIVDNELINENSLIPRSLTQEAPREELSAGVVHTYKHALDEPIHISLSDKVGAPIYTLIRTESGEVTITKSEGVDFERTYRRGAYLSVGDTRSLGFGVDNIRIRNLDDGTLQIKVFNFSNVEGQTVRVAGHVFDMEAFRATTNEGTEVYDDVIPGEAAENTMTEMKLMDEHSEGKHKFAEMFQGVRDAMGELNISEGVKEVVIVRLGGFVRENINNLGAAAKKIAKFLADLVKKLDVREKVSDMNIMDGLKKILPKTKPKSKAIVGESITDANNMMQEMVVVDEQSGGKHKFAETIESVRETLGKLNISENVKNAVVVRLGGFVKENMGKLGAAAKKIGKFLADLVKKLDVREKVSDMNIMDGLKKFFSKMSLKKSAESREMLPQPEKMRSVERTAVADVPRKKIVQFVGDLHGNFNILRENLIGLSAIKIDDNGNWIWTGGTSELVFLGDILADRNADGHKIMLKLRELKMQAREAGGDINVISGNHDDILVSYLMGVDIAPNRGWDWNKKTQRMEWIEYPPKSATMMAITSNQGYGLVELLDFVPGYNKTNESAWDAMEDLTKNREKIIAQMRKSPEGRELLNEICEMQILQHLDDTLFIHTPPNDKMLSLIKEFGIDGINEIYQRVLRTTLIDGKNVGVKDMADFERIRAAFLNTGNRQWEVDAAMAEEFKNLGINHIVHGHNGGDGSTTYEGDFGVTDADWGAGSRGGDGKGEGKNGVDRLSIGLVAPYNGLIRTGSHAEHIVARDGVEKSERAKAIEDESSKVEMAKEAQDLPRDLDQLEKNKLNLLKIEEGEEFAFSIIDEVGAPVYSVFRDEGQLIVVNNSTGIAVAMLNEGESHTMGLGVYIQYPSAGYVNLSFDDSSGIESMNIAPSVARINEGRESQKASSSVQVDFNQLGQAEAAKVAPYEGPKRNTRYREVSEVQRSRGVESVGDVHGNFNIAVENLKALGVLEVRFNADGAREFIWIGGDREVNFLGDIIADRNAQGLQVLLLVHQLREQANAAGGNINVFAGNHDDWMLSYLVGTRNGDRHSWGFDKQQKKYRWFEGSESAPLDNVFIERMVPEWGADACFQGRGMGELVHYAPGFNGEMNDPYDVVGALQAPGARERILAEMRNNPTGRAILEEMAKMKLVEQIDDTLFMHTNPNFRMVDLIEAYTQLDGDGNVIKSGVDVINNYYQAMNRAMLLEGKEFYEYSVEEQQFYYDVKNAFLSTGNRNDTLEYDAAAKLRYLGINQIVHGHSGRGAEEKGIDRTVAGLGILDIDFSAGKGGDVGYERSVATVRTNGLIEDGVDKSIYRPIMISPNVSAQQGYASQSPGMAPTMRMDLGGEKSVDLGLDSDAERSLQEVEDLLTLEVEEGGGDVGKLDESVLDGIPRDDASLEEKLAWTSEVLSFVSKRVSSNEMISKIEGVLVDGGANAWGRVKMFFKSVFTKLLLVKSFGISEDWDHELKDLESVARVAGRVGMSIPKFIDSIKGLSKEFGSGNTINDVFFIINAADNLKIEDFNEFVDKLKGIKISGKGMGIGLLLTRFTNKLDPPPGFLDEILEIGFPAHIHALLNLGMNLHGGDIEIARMLIGLATNKGEELKNTGMLQLFVKEFDWCQKNYGKDLCNKFIDQNITILSEFTNKSFWKKAFGEKAFGELVKLSPVQGDSQRFAFSSTRHDRMTTLLETVVDKVGVGFETKDDLVQFLEEYISEFGVTNDRLILKYYRNLKLLENGEIESLPKEQVKAKCDSIEGLRKMFESRRHSKFYAGIKRISKGDPEVSAFLSDIIEKRNDDLLMYSDFYHFAIHEAQWCIDNYGEEFYFDFINNNLLGVLDVADRTAWEKVLGKKEFTDLLNALPKKGKEKRNAFTGNAYDRTSKFFEFMVNNVDSGFVIDRESISIVTSYISVFGLSLTPILFEYYKNLELVRMGKLKDIPPQQRADGCESIEQIKEKFEKIKDALYSENEFTDFENLSEFELEMLSFSIGVSDHMFSGSGDDIKEMVDAFKKNLQEGKIEGLPSGYVPKEYDISEVETVINGESVQKEYGKLKAEVDAAMSETVVADMQEKLIKIIDGKIAGMERNKNPNARIIEMVEAMKALRVNMETVSSLDGLLVLALELDAKILNKSGIVRVIVLAKMFEANPSTKDALRGLENKAANMNGVLELRNVLKNIVKAYITNADHQKDFWSDEVCKKIQYCKGFSRKLNIAKIFNTDFKALEDAIDNSSKVKKGKKTISVIPDRGFVGGMSGYLANVCYTAENDLLKRYPNVIPFKFIIGEGNEKHFAGSVLVFEVEDENGDKVLLIRAFNVPDEANIDVPELFDNFVNDLSEMARARGIKKILIPGERQALSNYPITLTYLTEKFVLGKDAVGLKEKFDFNNLDITNDCYVVSDLTVEVEDKAAEQPAEQAEAGMAPTMRMDLGKNVDKKADKDAEVYALLDSLEKKANERFVPEEDITLSKVEGYDASFEYEFSKGRDQIAVRVGDQSLIIRRQDDGTLLIVNMATKKKMTLSTLDEDGREIPRLIVLGSDPKEGDYNTIKLEGEGVSSNHFAIKYFDGSIKLQALGGAGVNVRTYFDLDFGLNEEEAQQKVETAVKEGSAELVTGQIDSNLEANVPYKFVMTQMGYGVYLAPNGVKDTLITYDPLFNVIPGTNGLVLKYNKMVPVSHNERYILRKIEQEDATFIWSREEVPGDYVAREGEVVHDRKVTEMESELVIEEIKFGEAKTVTIPGFGDFELGVSKNGEFLIASENNQGLRVEDMTIDMDLASSLVNKGTQIPLSPETRYSLNPERENYIQMGKDVVKLVPQGKNLFIVSENHSPKVSQRVDLSDGELHEIEIDGVSVSASLKDGVLGFVRADDKLGPKSIQLLEGDDVLVAVSKTKIVNIKVVGGILEISDVIADSMDVSEASKEMAYSHDGNLFRVEYDGNKNKLYVEIGPDMGGDFSLFVMGSDKEKIQSEIMQLDSEDVSRSSDMDERFIPEGTIPPFQRTSEKIEAENAKQARLMPGRENVIVPTSNVLHLSLSDDSKAPRYKIEVNKEESLLIITVGDEVIFHDINKPFVFEERGDKEGDVLYNEKWDKDNLTIQYLEDGSFLVKYNYDVFTSDNIKQIRFFDSELVMSEFRKGETKKMEERKERERELEAQLPSPIAVFEGSASKSKSIALDGTMVDFNVNRESYKDVLNPTEQNVIKFADGEKIILSVSDNPDIQMYAMTVEDGQLHLRMGSGFTWGNAGGGHGVMELGESRVLYVSGHGLVQLDFISANELVITQLMQGPDVNLRVSPEASTLEIFKMKKANTTESPLDQDVKVSDDFTGKFEATGLMGESGITPDSLEGLEGVTGAKFKNEEGTRKVNSKKLEEGTRQVAVGSTRNDEPINKREDVTRVGSDDMDAALEEKIDTEIIPPAELAPILAEDRKKDAEGTAVVVGGSDKMSPYDLLVQQMTEMEAAQAGQAAIAPTKRRDAGIVKDDDMFRNFDDSEEAGPLDALLGRGSINSYDVRDKKLLIRLRKGKYALRVEQLPNGSVIIKSPILKSDFIVSNMEGIQITGNSIKKEWLKKDPSLKDLELKFTLLRNRILGITDKSFVGGVSVSKETTPVEKIKAPKSLKGKYKWKLRKSGEYYKFGVSKDRLKLRLLENRNKDLDKDLVLTEMDGKLFIESSLLIQPIELEVGEEIVIGRQHLSTPNVEFLQAVSRKHLSVLYMGNGEVYVKDSSTYMHTKPLKVDAKEKRSDYLEMMEGRKKGGFGEKLSKDIAYEYDLKSKKMNVKLLGGDFVLTVEDKGKYLEISSNSFKSTMKTIRVLKGYSVSVGQGHFVPGWPNSEHLSQEHIQFYYSGDGKMFVKDLSAYGNTYASGIEEVQKFDRNERVKIDGSLIPNLREVSGEEEVVESGETKKGKYFESLEKAVEHEFELKDVAHTELKVGSQSVDFIKNGRDLQLVLANKELVNLSVAIKGIEARRGRYSSTREIVLDQQHFPGADVKIKIKYLDNGKFSVTVLKGAAEVLTTMDPEMSRATINVDAVRNPEKAGQVIPNRDGFNEFRELSLEKSEMMLEMWPRGLANSHFEQQNLGNCWLLARLHSLKRHQNAAQLISRIVSKIDDNNWRVSFPNERDIIVNRRDLQGGVIGEKFVTTVDGSLGDQVIVAAYDHLINNKNGKEIDRKNAKGRGVGLEGLAGAVGGVGRGSNHAGEDFQYFFEGLNPEVIKESTDSRDVLRAILEDFEKSPSQYFLMAGTPDKDKANFTSVRVLGGPGKEFGTKTVGYMDAKEGQIICNHAYSIVSVENGMVKLANPHNTKEDIRLSIDEFLDYFSSVDGVKVDPNRLDELSGAKEGKVVDGVMGKELLLKVPAKFDMSEIRFLKVGDSAYKCVVSDNVLYVEMNGTWLNIKKGQSENILDRFSIGLSEDGKMVVENISTAVPISVETAFVEEHEMLMHSNTGLNSYLTMGGKNYPVSPGEGFMYLGLDKENWIHVELGKSYVIDGAYKVEYLGGNKVKTTNLLSYERISLAELVMDQEGNLEKVGKLESFDDVEFTMSENKQIEIELAKGVLINLYLKDGSIYYANKGKERTIPKGRIGRDSFIGMLITPEQFDSSLGKTGKLISVNYDEETNKCKITLQGGDFINVNILNK